MKLLLVVFAIVAAAAAFPDLELNRERRGILASAPLVSSIAIAKPALLAPAPLAVAAPIAIGPQLGVGLPLGGPWIKTIG